MFSKGYHGPLRKTLCPGDWPQSHPTPRSHPLASWFQGPLTSQRAPRGAVVPPASSPPKGPPVLLLGLREQLHGDDIQRPHCHPFTSPMCLVPVDGSPEPRARSYGDALHLGRPT